MFLYSLPELLDWGLRLPLQLGDVVPGDVDERVALDEDVVGRHVVRGAEAVLRVPPAVWTL